MGPSLIIVVVLAVFALLTASIVYRHDLYEHEPIPLLGVAVALGAAAMWGAGRIEDVALLHLGGGSALRIAAVAAVTEELLKLAVVVTVALLARREFDDPMDGVVYGSMAGLGMALEESLFYLRHSAPSAAFPAGELVRLWAHVVLGGIVGFPLGFFRARPGWAAGAAVVGLGVTAGLHVAWDLAALTLGVGPGPGILASLAGVLVMGTSLALYGWLVTRASERSRQELAPTSPARLWGWPFVRESRASGGATAPRSPGEGGE